MSWCGSSIHLDKTRKGCGSSEHFPNSFLTAMHGCWVCPTGTKMAKPNYFGSYSCSFAPVSHLPALLCPLCCRKPCAVSVKARESSHPCSSEKCHLRELCSWKRKGSSCLSAGTSHHVINVWWQEKHHWERLPSPAQGHGRALHRGCAEPASESIQFPDTFLARP